MAHLDENLAAFIAAHAHPYDAATDTYRRAPFAQPTKAGKNTAIYNAHSYHTKVPPQGIVPYIEHYTEPGDLVLDPFCGSGMTGMAALMTGRYAILNDLSPAAVHIARNYCAPVDATALRAEFERIKAAVTEESDWLYGTTCDRCGGPATIQHTIWSDVFECGRCGGDLVLWDLAVDHDSGTVREEFICPQCGITQNKKGLRRIASVPVSTSYECPHCRPNRGEHCTTVAERANVAEVEDRPIPYWYPSDEFPLGRQTRKIRQGVAGVSRVDQVFTYRNLWALSSLWDKVSQVHDEQLCARLQFVFTAITPLASRMYRYRARGGGGPSGNLYIPSLSLENNVLKLFQAKFDDIRDISFPALEAPTPYCVTMIGSAIALPSLPDAVVDYVFTDPPYGESLQYAELNFLWETWLRRFTNWSEDCVMNYVHGKDLAFYQDTMTRALGEMFRVLKPGRWASVVFHNTQDEVWQAIQSAAQAAGFELASVTMFDKDQRTFNQVNIGKKGAAGFDIILNLHKPARVTITNGASRVEDLEVKMTGWLADFLATSPAPAHRTIQYLHSYALRQILRENLVVELSMRDLQQMLPHQFKEVDGRWYLRGEAVMGGSVFDPKTDSGAITWLSAVLSDNPQTTGGLIPQWQAATAYLGATDPGRLERLLAENFWLDARTGRWRVPTAAERDKMSNRQSLADEAHLRVVRRFLAGDLDRRPHDWELSEWLRFCYRREAYAEAVALFQHIQPDQVEPERYRELKKIVAVCRMKAQE
jgi:DNA modification methylase